MKSIRAGRLTLRPGKTGITIERDLSSLQVEELGVVSYETLVVLIKAVRPEIRKHYFARCK